MNAAPQKLFSAGQISACRDQTWHQQEDRDPLLRRKKMGSILLFQSGPADESGARAHVHTRKHTHLFHLLWVQMIASHLCSQHHSSLLFSSVVAPFLSLSLSFVCSLSLPDLRSVPAGEPIQPIRPRKSLPADVLEDPEHQQLISAVGQ